MGPRKYRVPTRQVILRVGLALIWLPATSSARDETPSSQKQATAVPVPEDVIRLDGLLDESVWKLAPPLTDFVQKEPVEGATPDDRIEVRFVYDGEALYVGARMSSPSRNAIQAPLSLRDDVGQSEHLLISLDTYLDRRTAYTFGVTASGVRLDHFHPSDDEDDLDPEFDPVWEARTRITDSGWTAEMWIPFSQLRFNDRSEQIWGLNIKRSIPSRNEDDYWVLIPRTVQGWASRFGELRGIRDTPPSRRIEVLPYVGVNSVVTGDRDPANPFDDGRNLGRRVGGDFKMGLGPSLTLDATVNPDFGQVEADPAEVNLTAFETFFSERRPFFLEGSRVLSSRVRNNYFYSRRIGARPSGEASGDFVDLPSSSTILGAAKLTGRLRSGLSLGFLGAVTDAEHARIFNTGASAIERAPVAPRTSYGVARLEQEFGPNASTASFMVTMVHRDLDRDNPLAELLTRNTFTVNGDSVLRFKGGEYEVRLHGGMSYLDGEAAAVQLVQESPVRYLQRPDANYLTYDPTRTSLTGFKGGAELERTSGRHWLWSVEFDTESPNLELNDIGRLRSSDGILLTSDLRYRETRPTDRVHAYSIGVSTRSEWNYGGEQQNETYGIDVLLTWPNFWTTDVSLSSNRRTQDLRLTRGGPSMQTPRGWSVNASLGNSSAARHGWKGELEYGWNEDGGLLFNVLGELSIRPAPRWQISFAPGYTRERQTQQYVDALARSGIGTFGRRYIFAFVDRNTIVGQFRVNCTFKPDLTLDIYAEPFAASGDFHNYAELRTPRTRDMRSYGTDGTEVEELADGSLRVRDGVDTFLLGNDDFNVLSFRSNVVLRWEWRPGSAFFVVWQQDRRSKAVTDARVTAGDLFRSFNASGDNLFVVKASFWIPFQ